MLNKFQISDLLTNFGGSNWIDREVEGTLVAISNIVETDTMRYMKVCSQKKQQNQYICLTSLTCPKCGIPSTLCWKILNISGSIELFAL